MAVFFGLAVGKGLVLYVKGKRKAAQAAAGLVGWIGALGKVA